MAGKHFVEITKSNYDFFLKMKEEVGSVKSQINTILRQYVLDAGVQEAKRKKLLSEGNQGGE